MSAAAASTSSIPSLLLLQPLLLLLDRIHKAPVPLSARRLKLSRGRRLHVHSLTLREFVFFIFHDDDDARYGGAGPLRQAEQAEMVVVATSGI